MEAPTYDFAKNCMKLKEFGLLGGWGASKILLCRSATGMGRGWGQAGTRIPLGLIFFHFHAAFGENLAK